MARPVPCSSSGSRALVGSSHRHSISSIYGNGSVGELLGSGRCIEDEIQEMREMRKMVQARRGREDFTSLIEFLKNHEPPPGNFMSVPYASPGSKSFKDLGGRWLKLKHVGQRQSATAKVPKPLILPDSAVSGMTIGGHRHIAISIPLEAMPFADAAAVQSNHVSASKGTMPRAPIKDSAVRTFVDDEGVVTVLRATGGDALSSGSTLTYRPQPPYQYHRQRSSQSLVLTYLDQKANAPRRSHEKCSSHSTADTYPWRDPVPEGGGERSSAREPQRSSCYPARRSSVSTGWGNSRTITIDGVVSLYGEDHRIASGGIPRLYDVKPLPRTPANREKGIASKPSSRQPSPIGEESPGQELAAAQEMMTRPTSQASMASRRERVRTRKRRDMEALRKLSMSKGGHVSEDEGSGSPEKAATRSQSQLALCPIQVVVDLEPVPASVQGTMGSGSSSGSSADGEWDEPLTPLTPLSGSPVRNGKKPRQSLPGSSQQQQEQPQQHGKEAQTDNQILRLYDVFRENRMRDAERRIRRLERNGDVWLRALIPLLDDMHKSIKAAHGRSSVDEDGDEGRDMASDEGIGASRAEKRPVAATRKRSSSRERATGTLKLEEGGEKGLVREDGEWSESKSESKSASASTDASGMGAIEPLMRELSGEARRRQRLVVREYYNG